MKPIKGPYRICQGFCRKPFNHTKWYERVCPSCVQILMRMNPLTTAGGWKPKPRANSGETNATD